MRSAVESLYSPARPPVAIGKNGIREFNPCTGRRVILQHGRVTENRRLEPRAFKKRVAPSMLPVVEADHSISSNPRFF